MIANNKQYKIFNIINTLGNNKNFKLHNNYIINKISFINIYNTTLILRIKNLSDSLLVSKKFQIFFFNYIKKYHLGTRAVFKNNLKNNFKFFIYSLYKTNLSLSKFIKNFSKIDSIDTLQNLFLSNLYYPYACLNYNLSHSFFYNFLYKDSFKCNTFSLLYKFCNYSYLKSKKKKRFKHKAAEKLAALRKNLDKVKESPFRLKFYYKFFEYKRLHPYWDKKEFLEKKFKYFNPQLHSNQSLLYFFYKFRKFRNSSNKYDLLRKKFFINFWLQAKINKFKFTSYKLKHKQKKTKLKFTKLYLNSIINKKNQTYSNSTLPLLTKYKNYFFSKKKKYRSFLLSLDNFNKSICYKKNNKYISSFFKFLYSYRSLKTSKVMKNFHLFYPFKSAKIGNKNNVIVSYLLKRKKNLHFQLKDYNFNKPTKTFLFNSLKKSKFFRIKFKYMKWLEKQKLFKQWKYKKYVSHQILSYKKFKNNLNLFNFNYKISNKKFKKNYNFFSKALIYKAQLSTYNWLKYNLYMSTLYKITKFSLLFKNLKESSKYYAKNYSYYKSNKILDQKYSYFNLYKNKKLNQGVFRNKSKNNFILQRLSEKLFKKSWLFTYKNFPKSKKFRGSYNVVPIYNYVFINKVLRLYKKLLTSKITPSYKRLFNVSLYTKFLKKKFFYIKNFKNNSGLPPLYLAKINTLYRLVLKTRRIDRNFSFKKQKERQLLYLIKKYKKRQSFLLSRFKKTFKLPSKNSKIKFKQKDKLKLWLTQKRINKLKLALNFIVKSNYKKTIITKDNFKINYFKKSSFRNFLKYSAKKLDSQLGYSFNYFTKNYLLKNNSFLRKKNINKIRSKLLNSTKMSLFLLNIKNKYNLVFLDKLFINKIKKNNIIKSNWESNFLLKKNYFTFLRLFKFFSLYKCLDKDINPVGFGQLSKPLNINNENIFSIFNLYLYNFLNFSFNKNLFNDYTSTAKNLELFRFSNSKNDKSTENKIIALNYDYDILNKENIISKLIYSKHFLVKYWSLLNVNKLLSFKTFKFLNINRSNTKLFSNKTLFINFYFEHSNYYSDSGNTSSLKKIYYNVLDNYKNILFF